MYDLIVIGAGPAGYVGAIRAAQLGGKVAVVEKNSDLGGTCLNRGCIPTKALIRSVEVYLQAKGASNWGLNVSSISFNFSRIMERKEAIVKQLNQGLGYLFKNYGIELFRGRGKITSPGKVEVEGEEGRVLEGKNILIASGSRPVELGDFPRDGERIISSDEALQLEKLPPRLLVIGAGVNGCEFTHIFHSLGSEVYLVEMMEEILPGEDAEIARSLRRYLEKKGVKVFPGTTVERMEREGESVKVKLSSGMEFGVDIVLVCCGRVPNTQGMGLEEIGLRMERGRVWVDEGMRTSVSKVFAAGDVLNSPMLAHVAFQEGRVASENALGGDSVMDYRIIPSCIFTHPEIARVGLTEGEARGKFRDIQVGKFPYSASGRALCEGDTQGWVKVVSRKESGEILGVHIYGERATELIAQGVLALRMEVTVEELARTICAHPTFSETLIEAAGDVLGEAIHLPKKTP